MITRLPVSWIQVEHACHMVISAITRDNRVRGLSIAVPIARGGLIPGCIVAYALDLKIGFPDESNEVDTRRDMIVIDDICDTGKTFKILRARFPDALYVAAFAKPAGVVLCDYYGMLVPQDNWVVFPWAPNDIVTR